MSLQRLRELHPEVASDLADYAMRRHFTKELTDILASTLAKSIMYGDGGLWTDSFFVSELVDERASLRTILDRFPSTRNTILSGDDFASTLSTQHLIIRSSFSDNLDMLLQYNARNTAEPMDETGLLLIELSVALEEMRDETEISWFANCASRPLHERSVSSALTQAGNRLREMAYLLEDCIYVSILYGVHPLEALDPPSRERRVSPQLKNELAELPSMHSDGGPLSLIERRIPYEQFVRARRAFYWRLRDAAHVSPRILDNKELDRVSEAFRYEGFKDLCVNLDRELADDLEEVAVEQRLRDQCWYAAALVSQLDLPINLLISRLQKWDRGDQSLEWPASSKIVVSVADRDIQVSRFDVTGEVGMKSAGGLVQVQGDLGLLAPSPIWTDAVTETLEYFVNSEASHEGDIQKLFEIYPDFILDDLHVEAFPQVWLFQEGHKGLRPDFAIRRADSEFIDLLEIKSQHFKIVSGTRERPYYARQVLKAVAQLKECREWFRDKSNRRLFRTRYGLDGFEPRLTLIIGRTSPLFTDEARGRLGNPEGVEIRTYDDVLRAAKRRKALLV